MKVYWDTEDRSFIIENNNGKRMRITSAKVEDNPASDHIVMENAVLVHKVDPLDKVSVGDRVDPGDVAKEGVVLQLIGTDCLMIYCEGRWRHTSGKAVQFTVNNAMLRAKNSESLLYKVKTRMSHCGIE